MERAASYTIHCRGVDNQPTGGVRKWCRADAKNEVHMSASEDTAAEKLAAVTAGEATPAPRRSYRAPRILSREPLESVAAVCAPAPPAKSNPGACPSGPISS